MCKILKIIACIGLGLTVYSGLACWFFLLQQTPETQVQASVYAIKMGVCCALTFGAIIFHAILSRKAS